MASLKKLNGLPLDLAIHCQSFLSWLHPHLAKACREASVLAAEIELCDERPYPAGLSEVQPLRLASSNLREWLNNLLTRLGFEPDVLQSARVRLEFRPNEDYDCAVTARLETREGKTIEGAVHYVIRS